MKKIHMIAALLAMLLPTVMFANTGGSTTYYAALKAQVSSNSSGMGKVYAGTSTSAPSASSYNASSSQSSSLNSTTQNEKKNFYAFAQANDGYEFVGWSTSNNGSTSSIASPYTVQVACSSTTESSPTLTTVYANFKKKVLAAFAITFETSANGTYTVDGAAPANKTGLTEATSVTLASSDERFLNWVINGTEVTANPHTVSCTANTTISAVFLTADMVTSVTTLSDLTAALSNAQYKKITIPSGTTIQIPKGTTVTVPSEKQLVMDGTLNVLGTVSNSGTISGNGTLYKVSQLITQGDVKTLYNVKGEALGNVALRSNTGKPAKYRTTTVTANSPTVSGTVSCTTSWGAMLNGGTVYAITAPTPKALKVTLKTTACVNEITAITGTITGDIDANGDYLLIQNCNLKGPIVVESSKYNRLRFSGTIDLAGKKLTATSYQMSSSFTGLFVNGSIEFCSSSNYLQQGHAAFFNCSSVALKGIKNGGATFYFYDCGSSGSPATISYSYYNTDRTTNYRNAYYYCGVYSYTFSSGNDTDMSHVYAGSYSSDPTAYLYNVDEVEAVYNQTTKYYDVREKREPTYVCVIGTTQYESLTEAVTAAGNGAKIALTAAIDLTGTTLTVPSTKNITISLDKHTVTGGKIVNNGTLTLVDLTDANQGTLGSDIENNGTIDVTYGTYSGNILLNSGTFTTHGGVFTGTISAPSGVDLKEVANLRGGQFSKDPAAALRAGYSAPYWHFQSSDPMYYWVGVFPVPVVSATTYSGTDKAWKMDFLSSTDLALYQKQTDRSEFSSDADWRRRAELESSISPYHNYIFDCALVFDRDVSSESVTFAGKTQVGVSESLDKDVSANTYYPVLAKRIFAQGYTPYTFKRTILEVKSATAGVKNNSTANNGVVCMIESQLCTQDGSVVGKFNKLYALSQVRYMLGGKKAAIDRGASRLAYDSLVAAVAAVQNGETVLVGADTDANVTLSKVGTFTIDPYGFNWTGNAVAGDGFFFKSQTEGDSLAVAQGVTSAKAVTYVVAQKVASVGEQFFESLTEAVANANGAVVTLLAATDETITLTAEGQTFTLNKNGIAFDDAKVVTTIENGSVTVSAGESGMVYTAVTSIVDASDGHKYNSVTAAVEGISDNDISVTITANDTEEVSLPQGKTLTVTTAPGVTADLTVTPGDGAFIVESAVEGGTKYESKKITVEMAEPQTTVEVKKIDHGTESAVTDTTEINAAVTQLMGNHDVPRTDNTDKLDVLDKITVTPTKIVEEVVESKTIIRSATFDVVPTLNAGQSLTEGQKLKFRLPVDAAATQLAAIVYHNGAQFGIYPVQSYNEEKFIEVESDAFSPYGYTILDGETANPVAVIGTTGYASLAAAATAAQSGDTIVVIADITGEAVEVPTSVTITLDDAANPRTLSNVSINATGSDISLTVKDLAFTGNSWINSANGGELTVENVTADVSPSNGTAVNSRSAFIGLGRDESKTLALTVKDSTIVVPSGTDAILGWATITQADIEGNTIGSASKKITSGDAVKIMNVANGATISFVGNTVYSDYNGLAFAPNTTRANEFTAVFEDNTFVGNADHIWFEVQGSSVCKATVYATSDNTVNGSALTPANIAHNNLTWTSFAGVDVVTNEAGKVTSGTFTSFSSTDAIEAALAEDYKYVTSSGTYVVTPKDYVAQIGTAKYETLAEAIAAVPEGDTATTITMLADVAESVTIPSGKTVAIDLNGKTISYASGTPTILVSANGSLTVDDTSAGASGCIKNTAANGVAVYCDAGSVTVDNGTVGSLDTYRGIVVDHVGTVTVNDGSVIASNAAIRSTATAHDVITINGGTIGAATTDYAVYDYDYATIAVHGGVLNADKIAIAAFGSTLTIDGGEINKYGNTEYAILLGEAGTATISGGTITSAYTGIFMGDNGTTLNITGGTITAANQDGAISLNGTKKQTATINISGGTVANTGTGAAIYQPAGGTTVNVSGDAVLTGPTGIILKGGTLNISGGTITGNGPYTAPAAVGSGGTSTGDAVYVEDVYGPGDNNVNYAPTVNITGGTLTSVNGYAAQYFTEQTAPSTYKANGSVAISGNATLSSGKQTDAMASTVIPEKVLVSGGSFTHAVPEEYCAEGYIPTVADPVTGLYTVKVGSYVAQIGDVKYETFAEAIAAADAAVAGGGEDPVITVLDATAEQTNPDWKIADGKLIRKAYVAQNTTTGVKYESLAEAVAAANAGDTITMLADDTVSLTDGSRLTIDKSLTITGPVDTNGEPLYTIYGTPAQTGTNNIYIDGDGTVTLSNLKIKDFGNNKGTDGSHAPVYVASSFTGTANLDNLYISDFNRGGVFLYGGTFNVTDCYIDCANSRSGAFTKGIEIKGTATGTIADTLICNMERSGNDAPAGIEIYGKGSILVDGCTIISDVDDHASVKATYGIVSSRVGEHDPSGGSLRVTDCFIDVSNGALSVADSDEYGPVNNYSIVVDGEDTYFGNYIATWSASSSITINEGEFSEDVYADAGTITITDGTFNNFAPYAGTDGTIAISGGIFDHEVPEEHCAEGYIPATYDAASGLYTVKQGTFVAAVYDDSFELVSKHETLYDAVRAAQDGYTVELLADVEESVTIGKSIALAGECTITGTTKVTDGATVTMEDVSLDGNGTIYALDIAGGATVEMSGVTVGGGVWCNVHVNGGTLTGEGVTMQGDDLVVAADGQTFTYHGETLDASEAPWGLDVTKIPGKTLKVPFMDIVRESGTDVVELDDTQDKPLVQAGSILYVANMPGDTTLTGVTLPARFGSYSLTIDAGIAFLGDADTPTTGWTIGDWNEVIDTGSTVLDAIGEDSGEVPVELTLNGDADLGDNVFEFRYQNLTIDGANHAVSGTIKYTDDAGVVENIVLGTEEKPLTLDMTEVTDTIHLGNGVDVANVVVQLTTEQATAGTPVFTWTAGEGATAPVHEEVVIQVAGSASDSALVWDNELGVAYIGPCEARLTGPTHETPVYASLADALLRAASEGDTITLLMDITDFTGTQIIGKSLTLDGAGHKIVADADASGEEMFDVAGDVDVTIKNITVDGVHKYTYCIQAFGDADLTLQDVTVLHGTKEWFGDFKYGAGVHVNGANLLLKGNFTAFSGGKTDASFPFTGILYEGGAVLFADGATASIANPEDATDTDLLLVGMLGALDVSDPDDRAQVEDMLATMNVPAGFYPYTLKINPDEWNDSFEQNTSFTGASPLGWNDIIDYGKAIMGAIDMDTAETPVEVGLLTDTILPDTFTFEDANFTVNGNDYALSGTIEYTDNAGLIENLVMGTDGNALVLDMTGVTQPIEIGSGIVVENVTVKLTEDQATAGTPIIIWDAAHGVHAPENEAGVTVHLVDGQGADTGETAELIWDDEMGMAYIGPVEARLTGPTHDKPIYTTLAHAIELAEQSGDTVTLMMDIANFTGSQVIEKTDLVLDGAGHKIVAAAVTDYPNFFEAYSGDPMLKLGSGAITLKNITLDGGATHRYTYLVSADNDSVSLTTENIALLHGGAQSLDKDGNPTPGVGYGAAIHLNNGAALTVKDGFYADTHGAPAEAGQTIDKADGIFPFTGILPEGSGTTVKFELTQDTDANPTVSIGEDLLLVGMLGAIPHDEMQDILDYMKVPSRFIPYTLTLADGSAYAFTGASPRTWNDIIDYGKEIMDGATAIGFDGLDKTETPVEVGLLTDTELPDTFIYEDANFSVNGNGNALSGTIVFKNDAEGGLLRDIELGTEGKPLVLDLSQTTNAVDLGAGVVITDITVKMTEDQARVGTVVFDWNTEEVTGDDLPQHGTVSVTVVNDQGGATGETKGLIWDEEYGIAYIGPVEARLTGATHETPIYTTLADALARALDGDTVKLLSNATLAQPQDLAADATLDLAGWTVDVTGAAGILVTNATLSITNTVANATDAVTGTIKAGTGASPTALITSGEGGTVRIPMGIFAAAEGGKVLETADDGAFAVSGGYFSVAVLPEYCAPGYAPADAETGAPQPYTVAEAVSTFVYPIEGTAGVAVSNEWLAAQFPSIYPDPTKPVYASITNALVEALSENGANGMPRWECYVLGLDPTDANAVLRLTAAPVSADGTQVAIWTVIDKTKFPVLTNVTVTFRLAEQNGAEWTDVDGCTGSAEPSFTRPLDGVVDKVLRIFADITVE